MENLETSDPARGQRARAWLFATTALGGASPDRRPPVRPRFLPMGALAAALALVLASPAPVFADGNGGAGSGGCSGGGGGGGGGLGGTTYAGGCPADSGVKSGSNGSANGNGGAGGMGGTLVTGGPVGGSGGTGGAAGTASSPTGANGAAGSTGAVNNTGLVSQQPGAGGGGGGGGAGFVGSSLAAGNIIGGTGGIGGNSGNSEVAGGNGSDGGSGGGGGAGAILSGSGSTSTSGTVTGGNGGIGGASTSGSTGSAGQAGGYTGYGGMGGNGGAGILSTGVNVTNSNAITGGTGGTGGANGNGGNGGAGAAGGNAQTLGAFSNGGTGGSGVTGSGFTLTNTGAGSITGGFGGRGGTGGIGGNGSGAAGGNGGGGSIGGNGGSGVNGSSITVDNAGRIAGANGGTGGAGGNGGSGTTDGKGGNGGDGGNGAAGIVDSNATITNSGTIQGGNGGGGTAGGTGSTTGTAGTVGTGGVGVTGSNLDVITSGTIAGGLGGTSVRANAVTFTGGVNTLELDAGFTMTGNAQAYSSSDTLKLGGATNASFNAGLIGAQYLGFGSYVKAGTSIWTLTGAPSIATPWTLLGGELSVSQDASLGNPSNSPLTFNGGILQVTGTGFTTTARGMTWGTNGGGFDITDPTNTFTVPQNLLAGGSLTKLGAGTLVLSGTNTYVGGTFLNAGALAVGNNSALGTGTLAMANGTTLSFTRSNFTVPNNVTITGTGNVTPPAGTTQTLTGVIADGASPGTLAMQGPGTLVLTNANTYSGGTSIGAGTLQLGNGGTSGSIVGNVTDNGTLAFDRSDTATFPGTISGSGGVSQIGTGTTILNATNTYSGGTTISAGTLQLGNGGTAGSIVGNVADNGMLAFDRSDTVTFPGTISGTGGVSQIGTGTTILNATNTYTGPTAITAGTLAVGDASHASAALSGGGPVTVASGATLGGFGSVAGSVTNNGTIAVGNALPAFASGPDTTFNIGGNLTNAGMLNLVGATPGNTLTVGGNYTGNNGTVALNTVLNAGGPLSNQSTDRLLIGGNAGGSTAIQLHTTAGGAFTATGVPTASDGISIIQVAGTSSPNAFTLPGGYITGGTPFQYRVYAYGPGSPNGAADPGQSLVGDAAGHWDYRLQNVYVAPSGPIGVPVPSSPTNSASPPAPTPTPTPVPTPVPADVRLEVAPQVPAYITAPTALFNAGWQDIDELHRRLGEIRDAQDQGFPKRGEVFVRAYGGTFNYTSTRGFTDYGFNSAQDYAALQFGGSAIAVDNEAGTLRVGLAGILGRLWFEPSAIDGPSKGLLNSERLAGIATWQSRAGWYLDGILAGGMFDGRVSTGARGETTGLNGTSFAASIEGGYPIALSWQHLVAEPEVQLAYQHLDFGRRTDTDGLDVNIGGQDQGIFRLGGRLVRQFQAANGTLISPYLKANLLQGFGDGGDVNISGINFGTGQYGTALQIGGGVTGTLTSHLAIYGDVAWQHQIGNGGFRGWAFNGGLRYDF